MEVNFLLPHFGVRPTGGFKIAYQYANYLSEKGHKVKIIHTSATELDRVRYFRYIKSLIRMKLDKKWFVFNKNIKLSYIPILSNKYVSDADVTVATAWQTAEALERLESSKGKKVYLIQHYETWNGSKEDVDKTWKYDMHKIIISKWLIDIAKNMGLKRVTYIPNALDHSKFKIVNAVENRGLVISMMYADVDWKGAIDGINALKIVKERYPDIKVKFFGKCRKPSELPTWIEYYENPDQQVLVNDIYNRSAIFLCASWFEGWGLPAMEAMACGCAVVSTDNLGVNDFAINNETAIIVPIKRSDLMAKSIIKLCDNKNKKIELAYRGKEKVSEFTWEKSEELFENVLLELNTDFRGE